MVDGREARSRARSFGKVSGERALRLGAAAGVAGPALLAIVFIVLTVRQRSFLDEVGWTPVRRTRVVEWPSVLALGPDGWIETMAFVLAAALGVAFAATLYAVLQPRVARLAAVLLGVTSFAVAFMAFEPDPPTSKSSSWHDAIHNGVYPVIPVSALAAAALLAVGLGRDARWRVEAASSALFFVVGATALALTTVDAIAQLGRYFFFGPLLLWAELLAVRMLRRVSAASD